MAADGMRLCQRCGRELPESDFKWQYGRPKGACRQCRLARGRERRADPVAGARIRERNRAWRAAQPDYAERRRRRLYEMYTEDERRTRWGEWTNRWRAKNPERHRENGRRWRKAHPERARELQRRATQRYLARRREESES